MFTKTFPQSAPSLADVNGRAATAGDAVNQTAGQASEGIFDGEVILWPLAFGYFLPTSLLIFNVKTVFNHWSGEVGRSGLQLHRIFTQFYFEGRKVDCQSKSVLTHRNLHVP